VAPHDYLAGCGECDCETARDVLRAGSRRDSLILRSRDGPAHGFGPRRAAYMDRLQRSLYGD